MAQAIELIEYVPGKLYFVSSQPHAAAASSPPPSSSSDLVHFVDVAREFPYTGFYLDFGPLSLGHVVAFARKVDAKLEQLRQNGSRDARICVHASASRQQQQQQLHRDKDHELRHQHNRANAVCILGCWAVLSLGWSAERAFAPFKHLALPAFHDATRGHDSFGLSVLHVLRGLEKALQAQLISPVAFNTQEFYHYEQPENGDLSWISPQFLAFAGPHDAYAKSATSGAVKLAPEHYVEYFKQRNVALIVRLSRKRYDKARFTSAGLAFLDLYFPDGACPSDSVLNKFLSVCESTTSGAIAVHCKAGLGRTGTLIACHLMKTHRFSAEEAIAWLRLCRPGSVVGPQQHYLRAKQAQLWALSPLALPKELPVASDGTAQQDSAEQPVEEQQKTRKEGIVARQRRRSSLSGAAILKKVDQLRSSTSFMGNSSSNSSSSSVNAKKSHSVSPGIAKPPSIAGGVVAMSSSSKALLPPRIPGKLDAAEASKSTQGDLLVQRKQAMRQGQQHPAFGAGPTMGLWPFEPRIIM